MSKTKKTRFFARIDGTERLLFSVQKSTGGGLTITSRTPKLFEVPLGNFAKFEHQHYSIHESHGGNNTTITQKTQLDGAHHSNVTFLPDTKQHLLWPVFARRYPIFDDDANLLVRKPKDTLIELADYSYRTTNLLYSVFVSRPSFDLSILKGAGLNFKTASFEKLLVIAIPFYLHLPSMDTGDVVSISSSTTVINGKAGDDHKQVNSKPIQPEKFLEINHYLLSQLRDVYLRRIENICRDLNLPMLIPFELLEINQNSTPPENI